jgi:2'-5' RNA ligase
MEKMRTAATKEKFELVSDASPKSKGNQTALRRSPTDQLFFMIAPPRAITEYVAQLKNYVRDAVGRRIGDEFSKAHISLFKYSDAHAEDLLYKADSKISSFTPFNVYIKDLNVSHEPDGWSIYLEIVHKAPIRDIAENIAGREVDLTPRITIARNLELNEFLKVWSTLKELSYSQYFKCDHITVLKKAPGKWVHYVDLLLAA